MPNLPVLFSNPLQIPNLFSGTFTTTLHLGFVVFSFLLIVALLAENIKGINGQSSYTGLFIRALMLIGLFIGYEWFFTGIVYGLDLMAKAVLPEQEFQEILKKVFYEAANKKDFGILSFFSVITFVNFLTHLTALILLGLLTWLRFIFLALLYVMGPILAGFAIYDATSNGLKFWIRSLISVSAWTLVLSLLMKVISTMNIAALYFNPTQINTVSVIAANCLFILLFVSVPVISHLITSGSSISSLGTAVVGLTTAFVVKKVIPRLKEIPKAFPKGGRISTPGYK